MTPRIVRLDKDFAEWDRLLALILDAFAPMYGRIDPPSSALDLTSRALKEKAQAEFAFVAVDEEKLRGCIFCNPEPPDCLYIGKLAVVPQVQGRGVGRMLLSAASDCAVGLGLPELRLRTRIELVENHAVFSAWGFVRTGEFAHSGFERPTSIEMRRPV